MAANEDQAGAAVRYAETVRQATGQAPRLSLRSGGHGLNASSVNDGGIVLDVSQLKRLRFEDEAAGLLWVQAGATWGDVAGFLTPHDMVLTSGNFGDTGVGGLSNAGGVGYFVRADGLTIDRLRAVRLIGADGRVRLVDAEADPELFWGVRGGGSQLGLVTDYLFQASRLGTQRGDASVVLQRASYQAADLGGFMAAWGDLMRSAPREFTSFLRVQAIGGGRHVVQATNVWKGDDTERALPVLEAAAGLAPLAGHTAHLLSYPEMVPTPRQAHYGQQQLRMRDGLVDVVDANLGAAVAESLSRPSAVLYEIRFLGGAVADVPSDATAWAGRSQEALAVLWTEPLGEAAQDDAFAPVRALSSGAYGAYASDLRPEFAEFVWPGPTGERLRRLAQRQDPHQLFNQGLRLAR
ncbi:MAG: FAD-dependent oxidoreductase [Propionibacteriaceae bacterium]|nr:FAD-dependent oxidoreductase [Propionibacteriaceae bacterium]